MSEHLRDPELDRLIHELNRGRADAIAAESAEEAGTIAGTAGTAGGAAGLAEEAAFEPFPIAASPAPPRATPVPAPAATPPRRTRPDLDEAAAWRELLPEPPARASLEAGEALAGLLAEAIRRGASDLLLLPGQPPVFRVDGRLKRGEAAAPRGPSAARGEGGAATAWRFRVNLHRQHGQLAAALRTLPREVPTLASLNLPVAFAELVKPSRGLVLVCGPTGSGKSSTLAALIGEINRGRTVHIITIEDPVEYEHRSNRSLIEHVEVGRDARSFSEALRAALRQDPDVILVGEMRDLETMATAISAAETGHLVLATLHSNDAVQSVHRIVDVFPPTQQAQIRQQLALSLHAIVAQQLVPRADGRGRIPAIELMLATFPVRHHIRSDRLEKLYNEITLGKRQGMSSFEESLAQLVREGKIELEEARVRASHPEEFDTRLRG